MWVPAHKLHKAIKQHSDELAGWPLAVLAMWICGQPPADTAFLIEEREKSQVLEITQSGVSGLETSCLRFGYKMSHFLLDF